MTTTIVAGLPPAVAVVAPSRPAEVEHQPHKVGDTWYRYETYFTASFDEDGDYIRSYGPYLRLYKFCVDKITPKGVWVQEGKPGEFISGRRFVLNSSHKRYAVPTKEAALQSLMARKSRQAAILEKQLNSARQSHRLAELEMEKLTGVPALKNEKLDLQLCL